MRCPPRHVRSCRPDVVRGPGLRHPEFPGCCPRVPRGRRVPGGALPGGAVPGGACRAGSGPCRRAVVRSSWATRRSAGRWGGVSWPGSAWRYAGWMRKVMCRRAEFVGDAPFGWSPGRRVAIELRAAVRARRAPRLRVAVRAGPEPGRRQTAKGAPPALLRFRAGRIPDAAARCLGALRHPSAPREPDPGCLGPAAVPPRPAGRTSDAAPRHRGIPLSPLPRADAGDKLESTPLKFE